MIKLLSFFPFLSLLSRWLVEWVEFKFCCVLHGHYCWYLFHILRCDSQQKHGAILGFLGYVVFVYLYLTVNIIVRDKFNTSAYFGECYECVIYTHGRSCIWPASGVCDLPLPNIGLDRSNGIIDSNPNLYPNLLIVPA